MGEEEERVGRQAGRSIVIVELHNYYVLYNRVAHVWLTSKPIMYPSFGQDGFTVFAISIKTSQLFQVAPGKSFTYAQMVRDFDSPILFILYDKSHKVLKLENVER